MRRKRRFALQAVLDYRRHLEEEAQRAVAERRLAFQAHECAIKECEETAAAYARFARSGATVKIADARVSEMQVSALGFAAKRYAAAAEDALTKLDAARRSAIEASRDRRAIEILRDRALRLHTPPLHTYWFVISHVVVCSEHQ